MGFVCFGLQTLFGVLVQRANIAVCDLCLSVNGAGFLADLLQQFFVESRDDRARIFGFTGQRRWQLTRRNRHCFVRTKSKRVDPDTFLLRGLSGFECILLVVITICDHDQRA